MRQLLAHYFKESGLFFSLKLNVYIGIRDRLMRLTYDIMSFLCPKYRGVGVIRTTKIAKKSYALAPPCHFLAKNCFYLEF